MLSRLSVPKNLKLFSIQARNFAERGSIKSKTAAKKADKRSILKPDDELTPEEVQYNTWIATVIDHPNIKVPPLKPAEKEKGEVLAKVYSRMKMRRHRFMSKDLQDKINLKWAAIYALPKMEYRKEALYVDEHVPYNYTLPYDVPPRTGYPGHKDTDLDYIPGVLYEELFANKH